MDEWVYLLIGVGVVITLMAIYLSSRRADHVASGTSAPRPAQIYQDLRRQALNVDSSEIGISSNSEKDVWGVMMEFNSAALVTLFTFADGSTSLYFGNGGGIIGGGSHQKVREASDRWLMVAEGLKKEFKPTETFPFPEAGLVRFYLRTHSGTLAAAADETELQSDSHALSQLYNAGHAVISELRKMDEQRTEKG